MRCESGMYGRWAGVVRSEDLPVFYRECFFKFQVCKKFSDVLFLVSYICLIECTSVFVVVVP